MLHSGILPHHTKWANLFQNLRYVVIDELHAYRGVFGSHVANLMRRLARISAHYGAAPQFILASATIANPRELAERLIGAPVEEVAESGAPRGEKSFVCYNPPVVNPELGIRAPYLGEATRIALRFLREKIATIVFAQSRLSTEVLLTAIRAGLADKTGDASMVRGYRGGYLPNRRREVEQGLRGGDVLGVVSTNALELGVDIGSLDVAVLAGYPGSIASLWQQAGRAGRRTGSSAAVLVATSSPLDQYMVNHPDYLFGTPPEHARVNPDNPFILVNHLKCAAFELPLGDGEPFGAVDVRRVLAALEDEGLLHHAGDRFHWASETYPADHVSLRTVTTDNFLVIDTTARDATQTKRRQVIAEVDTSGRTRRRSPTSSVWSSTTSPTR
jgi:DEAD/DEAH box helicase domain-containing protein